MPALILGTPNIAPNDVIDLFIPGAYRSENGLDLSPQSLERVRYAASFFKQYHLLEKGGIIVCAGYKNPKENGEPWRNKYNEFVGKPEALSMEEELLRLDIPQSSILTEYYSFDTVTNFTNSRELLGGRRNTHPVGIVAQRDHLERIMEIIAPRVLRAPYIGLVAPEASGCPPSKNKFGARLFSRYVTMGMYPEHPRLHEITNKRVNRLWRPLLLGHSIAQPKLIEGGNA